MRPVPTSIVIATLVTVSAARPQDRSADEPSRMPPGPPPATTDADVAGLHRYEPTGLSILRPYRRGRIPVIFIHGLWSSPWSWSPMVEALEADPALRDRYQFWAFGYSTGDPIPYSAWLLRRDLDEVQAEVRPRRDRRGVRPDGRRGPQHGRAAGEDDGPGQPVPALAARQRPAVRGARGRPGGPRPVPPRPLLRPRPEVRRVVFIATPHRGSRVDRGRLERARRAARSHPGAAPGGLRAAHGPQRAGILHGSGCARACRPASTNWSGGRPSSRACRSWGWPGGHGPLRHRGPARSTPAGGATASSPRERPPRRGGVRGPRVVGPPVPGPPRRDRRGPAHPRRARGPLKWVPADRWR